MLQRSELATVGLRALAAKLEQAVEISSAIADAASAAPIDPADREMPKSRNQETAISQPKSETQPPQHPTSLSGTRAIPTSDTPDPKVS